MANSIVRFDPFEDLTRLQLEMNRLFDDSVTSGPTRRRSPSSGRAWAPSVDIHEDENSITVKADLPGVKMEDIDIEMQDDTLTIKGERKFEDEENRHGYVRIERSYGSFQRSFNVGVPVQADHINASYRDGLLTVTLPKAEHVKPKKVEIKVA